MKHILVILSSFALLASSLAAERKPSIIIFMADDLGYAGIGVNGCKDIPTPQIDSIAKNGVRFTDGYATHPVCSPSRAGLLSGRYQHRFGFEHNSGPERFAAKNFGLPRSEPTLAERLNAFETMVVRDGGEVTSRIAGHVDQFTSGVRATQEENGVPGGGVVD